MKPTTFKNLFTPKPRNFYEHDWNEKAEAFEQHCFDQRKKFLNALKNPIQVQKDVLLDIINVTKNSKFGQAHNMRQIKTADEFKRNIPIKTYDQLLPWINKEIEAKGGVLSTSPVIRWLKTSGTTGESKKIPYTKHWMENYRVPAIGVQWATYIHYASDLLLHPYAVLDTQTVRENPSEHLNGIPYQGITNRNPIINERDWDPPWYNAPWFLPDIPTDYDSKMYYRLRYMIEKDLRVIVSVNPSTLIGFKHHFIKNLPQLIADVQQGTLNKIPLFNPNPSLAKSLEKFQWKKSFSFKEIWPNLSMISCWTSATAKMYLPQLETLFPGVKIVSFMTCGTEGVVTLPIDDNLISSPLAINQGYYEFVPASVDLHDIIKQQQSIKTLQFNELKLDGEYHLIMSQANGLLRVALGDIYKVTGFIGDVPRLEFLQRHGTYHSFTGEKITEAQMMMAIKSVYNKYQIDNGLFMCCPVWGDPPYYKILMEVKEEFNKSWFLKLVEADMDAALSEINAEYQVKRTTSRLSPLKVCFTTLGSFANYLEKNKSKSNAVQFKYKPFQKDDVAFNEILSASIPITSV